MHSILLTPVKKRLCVGCVSKETRELWEKVVDKLEETEPELAFYCVPNCVYRGGCPEIPELTSCKYYERFIEFVEDQYDFRTQLVIFTNIDARYTAYHEWRRTKEKS